MGKRRAAPEGSKPLSLELRKHFCVGEFAALCASLRKVTARRDTILLISTDDLWLSAVSVRAGESAQLLPDSD
jgi:hypothetical protein